MSIKMLWAVLLFNCFVCSLACGGAAGKKAAAHLSHPAGCVPALMKALERGWWLVPKGRNKCAGGWQFLGTARRKHMGSSGGDFLWAFGSQESLMREVKGSKKPQKV